MALKVFLVSLIFYLLRPCRGDSEIHRLSLQNESDQTEISSKDLNEDDSLWRLWRLFRRWKNQIEAEISTVEAMKMLKLYLANSESAVSVLARSKGSVQNELVTMLFESMIDCVVESWVSIVPKKQEDSNTCMEFGKTNSELTFTSKKKKTSGKPSRTKRSRSRIELYDSTQFDGVPSSSWWSGSDENAIIRFRNGNLYEGHLSMKCMHGEGRFQWADGTIYLGQFNDNEMSGKGIIQWKNDSWYQGDFAGNLRHGKGLFVDSRKQRSYTGEWHYGTKHGDGAIYYSKDFKNSYDGHWTHNQRHGYGSREYCALSGYKGEWDQNKREGKGLMIWPNHDFYRGQWKNGVMSGYGIYIWDAYYNNTMSLPSMTAYRGLWEKGQRNGYGVLDIGLGLGSHYKGDFKNNTKHGIGKFVSNNGFILQHKNLFTDDNLGSMTNDGNENDFKRPLAEEPYQFDICDASVGLLYHIEQALRNIDKQQEVRANLINDYIENNKALEGIPSLAIHRVESTEHSDYQNFEDLIKFEESSLRKSLRCYETELKSIYYKYAKICNTKEIYFTPILIRLYLWQLYYDCKLHEKGLILVDIDNLYYQNPEWLARTAHGPFEKIYFWQFLHSLISVASKLYAKKELPTRKPDTILSSAFRTFMETDILPGSGRRRGRLVNWYGSIVPLKGSYELYRMLGEPHTVRKFMCAVRPPPHNSEAPKFDQLMEPPEECLPRGRNVYIFGDEMSFVTDDNVLPEEIDCDHSDFKLFNFANLSSKSIIKIFANIFPQLYESDKIMDLDIEITFFEFFEAFVACAEESNRIKDEEMRFKRKLSMANATVPHQSVHGAKK